MPFSCCSASFCKNNRYNVNKRGLDITFHTFPHRQYAITHLWIQFAKREENWIPHKNSVLCSVHFREDDFQMANSPVIPRQGKRIRHLKGDAVPTIVNRTAITVSKREKLDQVRKQLLKKLSTKSDEDNEQGTGNDHTYSEAKIAQAKKKGPVDGCRKSIFFLQRYPNVCAFCLKITFDANQFIPVTHYHEALECTIEQKFDEITGDPIDQEDRSEIQQLLPDKVCDECVAMIVKFHQYQRQLECIKKFSTGIAHLLYGNGQPLENLYLDQGPYLVNILKRLDTDQGTRANQSLEQLLEEVTSYGKVKQSSTTCGQHSADETSHELYSNTEGVFADSGKCALHSRDGVKKSKNSNSSKQLHTCPYMDVCKEWFLTPFAIEQHIRDDHKSFTCHVCGLKLAFYDLYKKHMESHSIARALLLSHNKQDSSLEQEGRNYGQSYQRVNPSPKIRKQKASDARGNWVCGVCLGVYANDQEFNSHRCSTFTAKNKIATPRDMLLDRSKSKVDVGWYDETEEVICSTAGTTNTSSKGVELLQIEFLEEMQ